MNLAEASALVTGGASGLGLAVARELGARGARVVIVDRNADTGDAAAQAVGATFVAADVADPDAVETAVTTAREIAPLRVLVNCAGIGRACRVVSRDGIPHPLDLFERVLRTNLVGTFNCLRLAAAAMKDNEPSDEDGTRGVIINTASAAAFDGQIGQAAYAASKAAITGMTLPIARDLASFGIRVNTIAPGLFDTPIYGTGEQAEAAKGKLARDVIFPRRLGHAEEFARFAVDMAANGYLNGEVVRLDGALRMAPR
jgi:NAD(P)-dependent dehydrogenase (short-subunit alcohol dehydrogenase family)